MSSQDNASEYRIKIYSLYWNNVDPRLVDSQKQIFNAFGMDIKQQNLHGMDHGIWMNDTLTAASDNDVIIIVDIDCIPLHSRAIDRAIASAKQGNIFGCAQSANHINPDYVYAGPMFIAITGKTWRSIGQPSLVADTEFDVGGRLSFAAQQTGHSLDVVYPSDVAVPKWLLGESHIFGPFTIYENSFLHLFESRNKDLVNCFVDISQDIVNQNPSLDYRKYIIRAAKESHERFAIHYINKKSWIGKIRRELIRFQKRISPKNQ